MLLTNIKVKVKKLDLNAKFPEYAHDVEVGGNSGADLFSTDNIVIPPMGIALVGTGISVEVPVGIDMQIRSRSGLAVNHQIFVLNAPGTVDPNYRGEVKVILFNLSDDFYEIKKGDKIAQAVFAPCYHAEFEIGELSDTARGETGFGQSGR